MRKKKGRKRAREKEEGRSIIKYWIANMEDKGDEKEENKKTSIVLKHTSK